MSLFRTIITGLLFVAVVGLLCERFHYKAELARVPQDVIAKMKAIQRDIGCVKIDGVIGPKTQAKYKIAYELAEKKIFNEYAAPYMTASGAPKGE